MIEKKFYTISEVSKITGIKPYVLRYWEQEFRLLRPARRESGQRRYTQDDVELINKIKRLLYIEKYSIKGAKSKLLEEKRKQPKQIELEFQKNVPALQALKELKKELRDILKILG